MARILFFPPGSSVLVMSLKFTCKASAFLYFLHFLKLPDSVKAKAIFLFQFEDEESLDILLGSLFTSFDCDGNGAL